MVPRLRIERVGVHERGEEESRGAGEVKPVLLRFGRKRRQGSVQQIARHSIPLGIA